MSGPKLLPFPINELVLVYGKPALFLGFVENDPYTARVRLTEQGYDSEVHVGAMTAHPKPPSLGHVEGCIVIGQMRWTPSPDKPLLHINQQVQLTRDQAAILAAKLLHYAAVGEGK
ncbi:MAG TPA: hypothetical protein VGD46_19475 [Rhizobacter sp.]